MRGAIAILSLCAGCTFGGGPTIGYGTKHGWFGGAELGGGPVLQGAVGYQSLARSIYLRGDLMIDPALVDASADRLGGGARLGAGAGVSLDDGRWGGIFTFGAGVGSLRSPGTCPEDAAAPTVAAWHVFFDLRYATEWELVLSPRYEGAIPFCIPC